MSKYLTRREHRKPAWMGHTAAKGVLATIEGARKKRNRVDVFEKIDGKYVEVPQSEWDKFVEAK